MANQTHPLAKCAVHTHNYIAILITQNERATDVCAPKWSGFILKPGTIHYLSDGLETRAPPYYKVHISVSAIIVTGKKVSRAVRSYKGCLETPTVVDLTTESASVRASTVDHSRNTMC